MRLHARLALVFAALLVPFGVFALRVAEEGAQDYFLEFTQRQNASIAMYMAERRELLRGTELDRDALAELAETVTIINPSVEVYVLDVDGYVIGQASAANTIARPRVALEPVREFLDAGPEERNAGPLLGDDPLNVGERRPFSAHPLTENGRTIGYVYAVLGGRRHATLLEAVRSSRSLRVVGWTLGGALAMAALGGAIVSFTLTRRLRRLTRRARRWQREAGIDADAHGAAARTAGDEIDALARSWEAMSSRLHEQYRALERAEAERRETVAGISHDLRTPLTTLQGYIETALMRRGQLTDEEERRCLETALRHSRRLERLVGDLFELSRLDAGERELGTERFAIAELAQDALLDFDVAAREAGVTLALDAPRDATPEVCADIALVQRVLENLLDNALRHVSPGGRIEIGVRDRPDGRVAVTVTDDGVGMSPETLARATRAGYRGVARRDSDGRSHAGLGLAIVRGIVALHGGTLDVESAPGHGSTFGFTLPGPTPRSV